MKKTYTVGHLRKLLANHSDGRKDDYTLRVKIAKPSIGSIATDDVTYVGFGFDWEQGSLLISTENRLVPKSKKEDAYDIAHELLMYLATKPTKRDTYEIRNAKQCLLKAGYTEEDFVKYRHLFHEVPKP
jgi:hypothetical protein